MMMFSRSISGSTNIFCVFSSCWISFLFINWPHERSVKFLWTNISGKFHLVFFLNRHIGPEILKSIKSHVMCNSQCLKATKQNNNKWYSSTLSHLLQKNTHLQHLHPWCHGKGGSLLNLVSWPQQKKTAFRPSGPWTGPKGGQTGRLTK